jgi:hypothetical protein
MNIELHVRIVVIVLIAMVSGCAAPRPVYIRYIGSNGASQQQFMNDRYSCLRETQQRISGAFVNQYGGASQSQVAPSCSAMAACLAARGYYRADTTNPADFNQPGSLSVPPGTMINCTQ